MDRLPPRSDVWFVTVYCPDSSELCTVGDLLDCWLDDLDLGEGDLLHAVGEGNQFRIEKTLPLADGQPMFVHRGKRRRTE